MLRRLLLKDFVIVPEMELDVDGGFTVLTGETGAGKSILLDAMQLALGGRGDALVVREGAPRAEISAEFDLPTSLRAWIAEAGFDGEADADTLLLRRVIDAQGRSRAWINGGAATGAQLREVADHLVDIHGQHAWQSLTRPSAVRALLDAFAGVDTRRLETTWRTWRQAERALEAAREHADEAQRERDRLAWQIEEIAKLDPGEQEWDELNAEHQRLAHAQSLIEAVQGALAALDEADVNAASLGAQALDGLSGVVSFDERLAPMIEALQGAQVQIADAVRSLHSYLSRADLDPKRLAELDARLSAWMALARRWRRPPADLPALRAQWHDELNALQASSDLAALTHSATEARAALQTEAASASAARAKAAPKLAGQVTQAMQQLGMAGGRLEVALLPEAEPQSHGLESVELRVAGHAGSTPRSLAKVASGGELSRLALAIAVTTAMAPTGAEAGTLIFDEIDAGIGGSVADTVGRLMKQLGQHRQVLAVTHLPQVAACADHHFVVAKRTSGADTASSIGAVAGENRVAEIARMLGGERLSGAGRAHAVEMLADAAATRKPRKGA